ncbi:hypothetical protein [Metabacillus endolithicus]|uniref:hypothetical protein n=1 Tax=Metabacillus endolithicus TaxID=1535204 RepID=UPI001FF8160D|nr:hypothetical protein [Metabacillus endolithicus]UPG64148.1 hypothetical protein MVE64_03180 [Metabacillus endolithicus]
MSFRKREDLLESLMKTNPFMNKAKKVINKKVAQYTQPQLNNMEAATTKTRNQQVKEQTTSNHVPTKIKKEEDLSNKTSKSLSNLSHL